MQHAYFFGYGSLVNRMTHGFTPVHRARVSGWRRAWRAVPERDLCVLTAVADPAGEIDGLIAPVPEEGWAALDLREAAYERHEATGDVRHAARAEQIAIYAVSPARGRAPGPDNPILLSYLDVVIEGYLAEYGRAGAEAFFDTTAGWQAPILDDRAAPRYVRATRPEPEVRAIVDAALARLGSRFAA
ncbi:gamma-glutamylcyclotransferase family protein [Pseudoponticoccus marisrubri]|uniref:Gamma-glutamylcyclotransferase n=1 Tax=Pseudoponticoccus marisrubri TaxID=1685382 RepID=A0A0W7WJ43_9RHOB|nr:gamma-glutamylcyclotransferase family protein [Pseudoponticoccus marisrubri]KUF10545.1 hypothetical protein AVJ23_11745 [Pseudoponticoccus marisrubri]